MRKLNNELFRRLSHWGDWRCRGIPGLGYPSMTAEARLRESPGRCDSPVARSPEYWPDRLAIKTQNEISTLSNHDQLLFWCCYAQKMTAIRAATAMGLAEHEYAQNLKKAHEAIGECLGMRTWIYT